MAGCKCPECYGLAEHLADHGLHNPGLPAAKGHNRLPPSTALRPTCTGTMTCSCDRCDMERQQAKVKQLSAARQPWQARAA